MPVFTQDIRGWTSWGELFQSREAFSPLIRLIAGREGLPEDLPVDNLTPGTNAVFGVGPFVFKIYAPAESGLDTTVDYQVEEERMKWCAARTIPCPRLLFSGQVRDKYLFRYHIMERVEGADARDVIFSYDEEAVGDFVEQIRLVLEKLGDTPPGPPSLDLLRQARENSRWKPLSPGLVGELLRFGEEQDLSRCVWVHGDLTGENVLVLPGGSVTLIDFADSCRAPAWYELPPLVFELFGGDPRFLAAFLQDRDREAFLTDLIRGLSLHDFSGDILQQFFARISVGPEQVDSIDRLRALLRQQFFQQSPANGDIR